MSALCAYSRYIACIGLFKHCKRIHSTESYFQKVALCILFFNFLSLPLALNGRSCVSVCVCWLLVAALLVVCVSETWPSVWYHVTGHWQAANQCCSRANTPLFTRLDAVVYTALCNCMSKCKSFNGQSVKEQDKFSMRNRGEQERA